MIGVSPDNRGVTASEIVATAESLKGVFPVIGTGQRAPVVPAFKAPEGKSDTAALRVAVGRLTKVADGLAERTVAMLRTSEELQQTTQGNGADIALEEMSETFRRASGRIRASWRVGVGMTLLAFLLMVSMIVSAVVLGIQTGRSAWTIVFGGVGTAAVLGTLLWRPYEKLFRATILAQQIEIIQVQTIAIFRGTSDISKRVEVCREAISTLGTLLDERRNAREDPEVRSSRGSRKRRK
jgi:hypothetical protein